MTGNGCEEAATIARRRGPWSERGVVGGGEGLLFGVLILVGGALMIVSAWAVVDRRMALDAAAREYLRSYTEQPDQVTAEQVGRAAALQVLAARGTNTEDISITVETTNGFGPCAPATVRLTSRVRWLRVPFQTDDRAADHTSVTVTHSELIDAHKEVIESEGYDPEATACARS